MICRSLAPSCLALIAAVGIAGCAQPLHLQYDFGRAYSDSLAVQANLDRPTAAEATYPLTGAEAMLIRENVVKANSAEKSGKVEATQD